MPREPRFLQQAQGCAGRVIAKRHGPAIARPMLPSLMIIFLSTHGRPGARGARLCAAGCAAIIPVAIDQTLADGWINQAVSRGSGSISSPHPIPSTAIAGSRAELTRAAAGCMSIPPITRVSSTSPAPRTAQSPARAVPFLPSQAHRARTCARQWHGTRRLGLRHARHAGGRRGNRDTTQPARWERVMRVPMRLTGSCYSRPGNSTPPPRFRDR